MDDKLRGLVRKYGAAKSAAVCAEYIDILQKHLEDAAIAFAAIEEHIESNYVRKDDE